ncbi:MAG: ribbon-helix-helix domain-containing protein [Acidobacteria bacterium]|nr:ribbon-helix-helix domain-containing protein [Acidobacteriota bacterium]
MAVHSVRLPATLAARLERLARNTRRSKSSYIVEALERYLDEREELEMALSRVREPKVEYIDQDEVKRVLSHD